VKLGSHNYTLNLRRKQSHQGTLRTAATSCPAWPKEPGVDASFHLQQQTVVFLLTFKISKINLDMYSNMLVHIDL
jgi:hypothetical protein